MQSFLPTGIAASSLTAMPNLDLKIDLLNCKQIQSPETSEKHVQHVPVGQKTHSCGKLLAF